MIEQSPWIVECMKRGDGTFLLFHSGMRRDVRALKHLLFGWHAPSFYGTMLPVENEGRIEGIVVTAAEMLEAIAMVPGVRWTELKQGDSFRIACDMAKLYMAVLREGRFEPSFEKWKTGTFGWELLLSESEQKTIDELLYQAEQIEHPKLVDWFDDLISELLTGNQDRDSLRSEVLRMRPELEEVRIPSQRSQWTSEQDWLEMIGWSVDETPFRVVLRIDEPEQERMPWALRILLQEKGDPDVQVACVWSKGADESETSCQVQAAAGDFPEAWKPFLQERLSRDIRKVLRIVPWLEDTTNSQLKDSDNEPLIKIQETSRIGHSDKVEKTADTSWCRLKEKLGEEEAWRFLAEGSLLLAEAGFRVIVPAWWQRVRQMRTRLKARVPASAGSFSASTMGINQMIQFDWRLAIGDVDVSEEEFRQLIEEDRRLVRLHGQWIQLNPDDVKEIRRLMNQVDGGGMTFGEVLEHHMAMERQRLEEGLLEEDIERDNSLQLELELNEQLQHWLAMLQHHESIPPSAMPVGLLGTLRKYQADGYSWLMFLRRFGLGACLADDMGLGKTIQWIAYVLKVKEEEPDSGPSLLICPTSLIGNWQKELERFAPDLQVYLHYGADRLRDERFAEEIQSADVVITTYTLALMDRELLWPVMWNSLCLDEAQNIKNPYAKQSAAIRKLRAKHRIALTGTPMENHLTELWSIFDFVNPGYLGTLAQFRKTYVNPIERSRDVEWTKLVQRLVQPFLLRRLKRDPEIQLDLPDKNESKVYVPLTAEQASVYEQTLHALFEDLDQLDPMERRGRVLAALTKLKQVCNHPSLVLRDRVTGRDSTRSGKLTRLLEMLEELRSTGERSLIFTQYAETGKLLQEVLERNTKESVPFLHGSVPKAERDRMVQRFQDESLPEEERPRIFILSLKAGGTGLNLTAANHVFHYDRWWNPAVENQASDRAYRIGQTRNVQVYKLIALGTLEERIDDMIEQKRTLNEQVIGGGEKWITELSPTELRELFALRRHVME